MQQVEGSRRPIEPIPFTERRNLHKAWNSIQQSGSLDAFTSYYQLLTLKGINPQFQIGAYTSDEGTAKVFQDRISSTGAKVITPPTAYNGPSVIRCEISYITRNVQRGISEKIIPFPTLPSEQTTIAVLAYGNESLVFNKKVTPLHEVFVRQKEESPEYRLAKEDWQVSPAVSAHALSRLATPHWTLYKR